MSDPLTIDAVLEESNQPLVSMGERDQLVVTLKPLAGMIEKYSTYAEKCVVNNASDAEMAAAYIEAIANERKVVETAIKTHKESSRKRWLSWCGLEALFLEPFAAAHKLLKGKCISWQESERLKAEAERVRLQSILDEQARREQERLKKEAAKLKTPELREARLEQAAAIVPSVVQLATAPKAVKSSRRWKVASYDLAAFVEAAAKDKSLLGYLTLETGKLERTKAANSLFEAQGIRYDQVLV